MRISLSPDLLRILPTYIVGIVFVRDAVVGDGKSSLTKDIEEALAGLLDRLPGGRLDDAPAIAAWTRAFASVGINARRYPPSVRALADRALRKDGLPGINVAVDLANLLSIRHLIPVGAHDMDRLPGDVEVRFSRLGDAFVPMGAQTPEDVAPGEPVYATASDVRTRRWVWRQSERAKVTTDSKTLLFPVDGFSDDPATAVQNATQELAQLVRIHLGPAARVSVAFLDAGAPVVEIAADADGTHDPVPAPKQPVVGAEANPAAREGSPVRRRPDATTPMRQWSLKDVIRRGLLENVIVQEDMERELDAGRRLTVYQGFDPTSPSLHMGHYLSLRVLRWLQLRGHRVIFLVGDFTGRIGDPTDRTGARQPLTHERVLENAQTYRDQICAVLDLEGDNPVEIRFNGDWLDPLTLKDVIGIAANVTVQQLIERDMFQARLADNKPLHLHEVLYPLLQGYDSVAMAVDAELGGRDQMFNMMMGRDLVKTYLGKTKHVLMTPLIPGLDGRKMSKTYGNTVDLTEDAVPMFFKLTLVDDQLLPLFLSVFTDADDEEIASVRERLKAETNLQEVRERFALEVTSVFHGAEEAERARQEFRRVVSDGALPSELPDVPIPVDRVNTDQTITVLDIVDTSRLAGSRADARRLIQQGGITINGERHADPGEALALVHVTGAVIKIGRRGFVRLTAPQSVAIADPADGSGE